MNNFLFFDIETVADLSAIDSIDVKVPSNYKDEAKIEAYIAEAKAEAIAKMALDPDLGMIKSISSGLSKETIVCRMTDEASMLKDFWSEWKDNYMLCCGYNIIGFDLPFMMRRSMALGVSIPGGSVDLRKYQKFPTLDLMGVLFNWDRAKSLKWVVKRYGIQNDLPDLDGSKVATMDDETLAKYSINDVKLTMDLYQKMINVYFQ